MVDVEQSRRPLDWSSIVTASLMLFKAVSIYEERTDDQIVSSILSHAPDIDVMVESKDDREGAIQRSPPCNFLETRRVQ